jgi:hypothetical protein
VQDEGPLRHDLRLSLSLERGGVESCWGKSPGARAESATPKGSDFLLFVSLRRDGGTVRHVFIITTQLCGPAACGQPCVCQLNGAYSRADTLPLPSLPL